MQKLKFFQSYTKKKGSETRENEGHTLMMTPWNPAPEEDPNGARMSSEQQLCRISRKW
jgi:hypothetical protein